MINKNHKLFSPAYIYIYICLLITSNLYSQSNLKNVIIDGGQYTIAANEICVKLKAGISDQILQSYVSQFGGIVDSKDINAPLRWRVVKFPSSVVIENIYNNFKTNNLFEKVEYNFVGYAQDVIPNDPLFSNQWALKNNYFPAADIGFTKAWEITTGSNDVIVGIFDTGIAMDSNYSLSHPDLDDYNRIILGINVTDDTDSLRDLFPHGTFVAGIIGAETNNNIGISGVCWNCKLLIIKGINLDSLSKTSYFRRCIEYLVNYKTNHNYIKTFVLNASVFYPTTLPSFDLNQLFDAVKLAESQGILIVVSAGNYGPSVRKINYLATLSKKFNNIISVGATSVNNEIAAYSSTGSYINVCAPGGDGQLNHQILSLLPPPAFYGFRTGTSYAAPFVSGLVGLINSMENYEPNLIRKLLENTAIDKGIPGFDTIYGFGIINPEKALKLIQKRPKNLNVSVYNNRPKLTWDKISNALYYKIYRGVDFGYKTEYEQIGTTNGNVNYFVDLSQRIFYPGGLSSLISYRVTAIYNNNEESFYSNKASIFVQMPALEKSNKQRSYSLHQNYPNPFNNSTKIKFEIAQPGNLHFEIIDLIGRKVMEFERYYDLPDEYEISLNLNLPSGIYIYSISINNFKSSKKMIVLN